MSLWLAPDALVLASRSSPRRAMLEAAGIPVEVIPAEMDERAIEAAVGARSAGAIAALLAHAKAAAIAATLPGRLVLGADQTLCLGVRRFSKPADRNMAREQLQALAGKTHELYSAVALVRDGDVVFEATDVARLTMRPLSDDFIARYLDTAGGAMTASVGAYQLEGLGIHLFERVEGDHFTVLGLPLLPLLRALRAQGYLAE